MSRRYGRTQKRHHRERIAELERESEERLLLIQKISDEMDSMFDRLRAQEDHVREIADTIQSVLRHSVLMPPTKVQLGHPEDNPAWMNLVPARQFNSYEAPTEIERVTIPTLKLDLWLLRTTLEDNGSTFERLVHVLVPGPHAVAYRVSGAAFAEFKRAGKLPELARAMYGQIRDVLLGSR